MAVAVLSSLIATVLGTAGAIGIHHMKNQKDGGHELNLPAGS